MLGRCVWTHESSVTKWYKEIAIGWCVSPTSQNTAQLPSELRSASIYTRILESGPRAIGNCRTESTEKHTKYRASSHGPTTKLNTVDILIYMSNNSNSCKDINKAKHIHTTISGALTMCWALGIIFLCKHHTV